MLTHLVLYSAAFIGIWVGAGLAIGAVERFSHRLKLSSFAVSFLLLGLFTSISELSVGINSVLGHNPEIYVGNLIGASIVIFMLVIPLLAITQGQVKINKQFIGFNLIASLIVVAFPVVLAMDGVISKSDSIFSLVSYVVLLILIETKKGLLDKTQPLSSKKIGKEGLDLTKAVIGVAIIFLSSKFVVSQTLYLSSAFQISPFLMSLLLVGVGTNIPELSLVIRSLFEKNSQVALGDYMGSAAFNTFLLGILGLWYGQPVVLTNSYIVSLLFLLLSLFAFFLFARSKNSISRIEGVGMLFLYGLFVFTEIILHQGLH